MHDDLLADLDTVDFAGLTQVKTAEAIPLLLSALDGSTTLADAERAESMMRDELARESYADGVADMLTATFLARLVNHHPLELVQTISLRLIQGMRESHLLDQALGDALPDAYATMRKAKRSQDVSGAIGLALFVDGYSPRLFKELRRLELRSANPLVLEAITTIRHQALI